MKHSSYKTIKNIAAVFFIFLFTFGSIINAFAAPNVPETIKVGLSYNSAATNNFTVKSDAGLKVFVNSGTGYVELINHPGTAGFKLRKDSFYNIINNKETEINYVSGNQYTGLLEGAFHIQIGDVYPDMSSAKLIADTMAPLSQTIYLVYENGWRVWAQLYMSEAECLTHIEKFKAAMPNYIYTVITPDKKRVQLFDGATGKLLYIINAEQDVRFESIPVENTVSLISYGASKYRGSLSIKRVPAGHVNIYNELLFEEYLYGVVPSEVPNTWHMEALKAQAVAARNYGILSIGKHTADGFDICNGQHCQVYKGYNQENTRTNQAIVETKGKLVLYNDKLISTYFHSSSGGRTENSENIWTAALPYIRAVDDQYGLGSPYDNWTKQYNKSEVKAKLLASGIDIGDIVDIVPLQCSVNGRITLVEIRGTKGAAKLEKEKIRTIMGTSELRSIWYTLKTDSDLFVKDSSDAKATAQRPSTIYVVSASGMQKISAPNNKIYVKNQTSISNISVIPENYIFTGKGFGHGLGMSQYGAKGMAEAGFNYKQILEYYFTGAKVN